MTKEEMEDTLTPEQIKNWRQIIYLQIEERAPGAGIYATIMPEAEVILFWRKMKALLESPEIIEMAKEEEKREEHFNHYHKKQCNHSNSITGQNGTYCLDCDKYI